MEVEIKVNGRAGSGKTIILAKLMKVLESEGFRCKVDFDLTNNTEILKGEKYH